MNETDWFRLIITCLEASLLLYGVKLAMANRNVHVKKFDISNHSTIEKFMDDCNEIFKNKILLNHIQKIKKKSYFK